jgi:C-methyltransferase
MVRGFERLTDCVRGTQPGEHATIQPDWLDFARGLTDRAVAARALADLMAFPAGPRKVLDVCAREGTYGISVAERYPEAIVVAADRPAALKLAQENAVQAKLGTRFQNIAGDPLAMSFGRDFDAAICAGGLYQFDPPDVEQLMKRIRDALKKTGQLFIVEFLSEDSLQNPGFGLTMLTATRRGAPYSMAEAREALQSAGFGAIESQPLPAAYATLITARH